MPEIITITIGNVLRQTSTARNPEFRLFQGRLQYRLVGDTVWIDLGAIPFTPASADAGTDQDLPPGSTAGTLTGSGASSGTIISYLWEQVSGPNNAVITTPAAASTTVTGLMDGAYVFRLTVTDSNDTTASDTVTLSVQGATAASYETVGPWFGTAPTGQYGKLYLPAGYNPAVPNPITIVFNGGGENGSGLGPTGVDLLDAATLGLLISGGMEVNHPVFLAQTGTGGWNDTLTTAVVAYAKTVVNVDNTRIYLSGASSGAEAAIKRQIDHPGEAAAAFVVGLPNGPINANAALFAQFPLYITHGMSDVVTAVSFPAGNIDAINAINPVFPPVLRTVYGGTHHSDTWNPYAYDYRVADINWMEWVLLHTNVLATTATNYVVRMEGAQDILFWRSATQVVAGLPTGATKTALQARLDAWFATWIADKRMWQVDLGQGSITAPTGWNKIGSQANGNETSLVDYTGAATTLKFKTTVSQWVTELDNCPNGKYWNLVNYRDGFRAYGAPNGSNLWEFNGADNTAVYDIYAFWSHKDLVNSNRKGTAATFGGVTRNTNDDVYNGDRYSLFPDLVPAATILPGEIHSLYGVESIYNTFIVVEKGGAGPGEPDPLDNPAAAAFVPLRTFTVTPDADGRVDLAGASYLPGDLIQLSGDFKWLQITGLNGTVDNPIVVQNKWGEVATVGDPTWDGGSYAGGLSFLNCHHFRCWGTNVNSLIVNGSTADATRMAYFNLSFNNYSDNFRLCYMTVKDGGTGIWCKKEVVGSDPNSFGDNPLDNIEIDHVLVQGTWNEGMYLGHSATFWNINTNTPAYPNAWDAPLDPAIYEVPIRINNLKVHHNLVRSTGADGIQIANCDNIEINNNELDDIATRHDVSHNGGIIVGGVTGHSIHDNHIHDSWGELIQLYAKGPGTTHNNLLVGGVHNGIGMRTTNNAIQTITNNTIAVIGEQAIRVNGHFNGNIPADPAQSPHILQRNILADPLNASSYIYLENQGKVTEGTAGNANVKQLTLAGLDTENWYLPASGTAGYRHTSEIGIPIT